MSLFGRGRKGRRRYRSNSTRAKQRCTLARVFGAAALQPFSVLRPFYERRALFGSFVRERERERERESGGRGTGARSLLETVRVTFYGMMVYTRESCISHECFILPIFSFLEHVENYSREWRRITFDAFCGRKGRSNRWLDVFWRRVKLSDRWILSSCNSIE